MKYVYFLAAAFAGLSVVPPCQADVLTFEHAGPDRSLIYSGYGGLSWDNFRLLDTSTYYDSGYVNGVVSPSFVAYNAAGGNRASVSSPSAFTFNGAWLTAAWNDGLSIQVTGYRGGVEQYSRLVNVDTSGPTWFDFGYVAVDSVVFEPFGGIHHEGYDYGSGTHFGMDNFDFSPVPVPTSLVALASLGGVGMAIAWRRRRSLAA